jgi:hypothetical protein
VVIILVRKSVTLEFVLSVLDYLQNRNHVLVEKLQNLSEKFLKRGSTFRLRCGFEQIAKIRFRFVVLNAEKLLLAAYISAKRSVMILHAVRVIRR